MVYNTSRTTHFCSMCLDIKPPHYTPVLKLKSGELKALEHLRGKLSSVTPIFDVTPPKPSQNAGSSVEGSIARIMSAWMQTRPFFLDCGALDTDQIANPYPDAPRVLAEEALRSDAAFIPVISLKRSRDYVDSTCVAVQGLGNGSALRLFRDELEGAGLKRHVDTVLEDISTTPSECDLLIDYRRIEDEAADQQTRDLLGVLPTVPYLQQWRSVIFLATTYPKALSKHVSMNEGGGFQRTEWLTYKKVWSVRENIARVPAFGDYGITNPSMEVYTKKIFTVIPSLKYTTDTEIIAFRAEKREGKGNYRQYRELARFLVGLDEFEDGDTWADNYLRQFARSRSDKNIGPTTMVAVGTARHIEKVARQIDSLSDQ